MLKWLIQRKIFISMLFTGLTLLGIISYRALDVELMPDAELPMLFVQVAGQIESDPAYMEKNAIIPLEGAIGTLEGIEEIHSFAEQRGGMIMIYYSPSANLKYAYLKLQEKVDAIRSSLPDGFFVEVVKVDTEQLTNQFMSLEVRGSGGTDRIRRMVDDTITPALENIDGVANVEVFGGRQKSVEIILDEQAAESFGITAAQIRSAIRGASAMRLFAGRAVDGSKRYFVNVAAEFQEITDLEQIVLRPEGPILLKDVAEIFFGVKEPTSLSRVNGKEAVTVQMVRDGQANLIALSHASQEVIDKLNKELASQDIQISVQSNAAETMEKNIDLIIQLAITGGILAVFILWIFLRNAFLVTTIALAIPISIFTAMNFFFATGVTLNSLTLVGVALAVGMLLDNSVVVLENVYRLAGLGRSVETAVLQGTREVWRSIFAATATTIAVFLPFIFTSQFLIRLLGKHISVSIISTLLVSLAVALLLIPMITYNYFKRRQEKRGPIFERVSQNNRLVQLYTVLLKTAMRFPTRTIIGGLVLFFLSLFISLALSLNVSQEAEDPAINLYATMASGSTLETTDKAVEDLEKRLASIPEKKELVSRINEAEAILTLNVVEDYRKVGGRSLAQIKSDMEDRVDDFRLGEVSFEQPQSSSRFRGGGGANPGMGFERMLGIGSQSEKVVIIGEDFAAMRAVAEDIQSRLEDLTTMERASLNISDNRPEMHLEFDNQLLSQYNISLSSIMGELATFRSSYDSGVEFRQGTEIYDITIRPKTPEENTDKTMDDLRTLDIPAGEAGTLPLSQLSNMVYATGLSSINRVNQEKRIEVTYRFQDEVNGSKRFLEAARLEVDDLVSGLTLPEGVAVEVVHDENDFTEFYYLFGASFVLILMILASVFESFFLPFVILFAIPFAGIGSLWGLILTGHSILNANTLMGMIILLGVVVNNAIILIDYTRILRQRGMRRNRALLLAGQARLRPILITAITTIIGMLPLAMGKAQYVTQIGAPFAITVIGGLAVSTLLTLVFIPTVYSGLETALGWIRSQHWKLKTVMFAALAGGLVLIQLRIDAFLWKLVLALVLLMVIPALTYFIKMSLRRAGTRLIGEDDDLVITIRNMVKIYERPSRFAREWNKGKTIRRHAGLDAPATRLRDLRDLRWQLPLLGFLIYFVYTHITSGFFLFLLSHFVYLLLLSIWTPVGEVLLATPSVVRLRLVPRLIRRVRPLIYWGAPVFHLVLFQLRWKNPTPVAFIGVFWALILAVYTTANRLHRDRVNIGRITGRFSGLRRRFYRLVQAIPVIGKRKRPFRAVNRVSLKIGKGMFGLLGPNGAGKSTLMRIVCGILEPSYGKIDINGIDLEEKREELQGLIGYLPQEFGMYENMTAWEFLQYQAMLKGLKDPALRDKRIRYVLESVHMIDHKDEKIGSFSGGMKQRIGIAQILLHLPRILVVDEPTAGLDPRERIRFRNLLVELSRERIVIFSTHIIEDISSSCNRLAVLNRGELQYVGEPVKMTQIAEGHVWQFHVPIAQFESLTEGLLVIHHMRDGEQIRVRALSENAPHAEAITVRPTLEDAYLWLLRGRNATREVPA